MFVWLESAGLSTNRLVYGWRIFVGVSVALVSWQKKKPMRSFKSDWVNIAENNLCGKQKFMILKGFGQQTIFTDEHHFVIFEM